MSLPAEIISRIVQCLMGLNVYKVILFGSYARGTATEDSDIDLVVVLNSEEFAKSIDERLDRQRPVSSSVLEINRLYPMDVIVYSKGEYDYLKNKGDFFVKEVEETGVKLYGE
jgi:predicted nucleotidyltransferase